MIVARPYMFERYAEALHREERPDPLELGDGDRLFQRHIGEVDATALGFQHGESAFMVVRAVDPDPPGWYHLLTIDRAAVIRGRDLAAAAREVAQKRLNVG